MYIPLRVSVFAPLLLIFLSACKCVFAHSYSIKYYFLTSTCHPFNQALPSSTFTQRLSLVWCAFSCMCMFLPPPPPLITVTVLVSPRSTTSFDPSLKPCKLISPVCPQQQQQAWWHSRWQWPQERRVHPQQQSTLAPYRHRPLDEAICLGHLWEDDIISSQPIKMS